ncbi:proteasome accessory factor PafA2 family protein [Actinomyces sp. B33]|uniref:proteasome accessory factor PafA2 family protein n=1 Tax=Actinomyces sp. B33 TaxID=2942131 RepID=UPI0023407EC5|nr:proteasome accessory factor PafA2 family protein [Actinomyces sp. B33]MDC4232313.1 proteasome accessory factor PafA2 family protein [Actinomyces sp. B33]
MSAGAGRLHRVVGIETEYGATSAWVGGPRDGAPLSVREAVEELFRDVSRAASGSHRFTATGARLYVDVGLHPEFAGPECASLIDVVAHDLAGDHLLRAMTAAANERLESRGARLHVLKSNTDAWGATFGCHENYQVEREVVLPLGGLIGLLAARQILTGAGALPPLSDGPGGVGADDGPIGPLRYSARAGHIHGATSADPTHERAFINTRDEPHADASRWRRLHVVAGDSAMSPSTTALKVALVDGALALVERGAWDLAECELVDPAGAAHVWNEDPTARCDRAGGMGPISCPDLLDMALDRLAGASHSPDEQDDPFTDAILDLARRGARALRTGDASEVDTELDWAIKHRVLSRVAQRCECGWDDPRVRRADLAYHDLSGASGLRDDLLRVGLMVGLVDEGAVERATRRPPVGTRAELRGRVVEACERTGRQLSVGWSHVRLDEPPRPQIDLPDPLSAASAEVDALIEEIVLLGPVDGPRLGRCAPAAGDAARSE